MQQDKRQGYQPQLAPGHQPGIQPGGKMAVLGSTVQLYDACNAAWQIGQGKDGDGCHAQWLVEHLQEDLQHMQQDCTGCIYLEPWGRSATHATRLYNGPSGTLGKICNTKQATMYSGLFGVLRKICNTKQSTRLYTVYWVPWGISATHATRLYCGPSGALGKICISKQATRL